MSSTTADTQINAYLSDKIHVDADTGLLFSNSLPISIDETCSDADLATIMRAIHNTLYRNPQVDANGKRKNDVHIMYKETGSNELEKYYLARTKFYAILVMGSKLAPKGRLAGYVCGLDGDEWTVTRKPSSDVYILKPQPSLKIDVATPYVPGHTCTIYVNRRDTPNRRVCIANDRTMDCSNAPALKFRDVDVSLARAFYEYMQEYDQAIHVSRSTDNPIQPNYYIVGQPPGTLFTQYFNPEVKYRKYTRTIPGSRAEEVKEDFLELDNLEFGQSIDFIVGAVNAFGCDENVGRYYFIDSATSIVKPVQMCLGGMTVEEAVRTYPDFKNGVVVKAGVNSRGINMFDIYDYNFGFRNVSGRVDHRFKPVGSLAERQAYTREARLSVKPVHRAPYQVTDTGKVAVCTKVVCAGTNCPSTDEQIKSAIDDDFVNGVTKLFM